jgi:hypothetical protein
VHRALRVRAAQHGSWPSEAGRALAINLGGSSPFGSQYVPLRMIFHRGTALRLYAKYELLRIPEMFFPPRNDFTNFA